MKEATIRIKWSKSPSQDVTSMKSFLTVNGVTTETTIDPSVEEMLIDIRANSNVSFRLEVSDAEGNIASSVAYTFTLGDLEAPLPPTNFSHEIVDVHDVPDAVAE